MENRIYKILPLVKTVALNFMEHFPFISFRLHISETYDLLEQVHNIKSNPTIVNWQIKIKINS